MVNKIIYRERLFEQKYKQCSTKYYTENDYLSKNTNNGQQNTIDYLIKNTNNGQQNNIQRATI